MFSLRRLSGTACIAVIGAGCVATAPLSSPPSPPLTPAALHDIDAAIVRAVDARKLPGAVFWLERQGVVHASAQGRFSYDAGAPAVRGDTVFDAASLTKVLATAPSVLLLVEEGKIALDAPLRTYFADCDGGAVGAITVRQLLTHTSGLPSGLPRTSPWEGDDAAHALACSRSPTHAPGTFFRYSDINFILLGQLVARVAGMPLDQFARERLFVPLGMADTGFRPLDKMDAARIAPTRPPEQFAAGIVHDPSARRMGGVAGSAGVFTTASDIARFARMLLAGGVHQGRRVLGPDSVKLMSTVQTPPGITSMRAMGMDIASPFSRPRGQLFPVGSFGHTGFTGCILWIDPFSRTFYVFLSNRVYPDDKSDIVAFYSELGTLAARAVAGVDFSSAPRRP